MSRKPPGTGSSPFSLALACLLAAALLLAPARPLGAAATEAAPEHGSPLSPGQGPEGKPALTPGTIIKLPEAKVVSFEEMMRDLRRARVVYLGENHDNKAQHDGQLAVIKGLQERVASVAIGMEMFQRPYQAVLDAWSSGQLDAKQFINQAEWYDRWSMDYSYYEPILEHARQGGKKLLALNASEELVRAVATKGVAGLTPEQRAELPPLKLDKPEQRHFIEHMYESQGTHHHQTNFDHFWEAQRVWDETMAQSVADYLSGPGAAQVVAVIAGNGHIEYGLGIPDDLRRRSGVPQRIVSFQEADHVTWGPGPGPPVAMSDYGRPLADYVWLTTASEERERPRLGVLVGKQPEGQPGVKIEEVVEGSPAARAGLKAGDAVLALDNDPVNSLGDVRYVLSHRKMGDRVRLEVLRGGKRESLELTLSPLPKREATGGMPKGHGR